MIGKLFQEFKVGKLYTPLPERYCGVVYFMYDRSEENCFRVKRPLTDEMFLVLEIRPSVTGRSNLVVLNTDGTVGYVELVNEDWRLASE